MTWWNWSGRDPGERERVLVGHSGKKKKKKEAKIGDSRILKIWKFGGYITKIEKLEV
jgi:hypothetical protein